MSRHFPLQKHEIESSNQEDAHSQAVQGWLLNMTPGLDETYVFFTNFKRILNAQKTPLSFAMKNL